MSQIDWITVARARAKYPDARIAMACARVLVTDLGRSQGHEKRYRQRALVTAYEQIARRIERDLQRVLRTAVPSTDAWTSTVTREMAAAHREAQRNVFFGEPGSGIEGARNTLVAALTGDWSLAPRAEYRRTDEQKKVFARIVTVARFAIVGLAPLGTVLALRHYDVVQDLPDSVMFLAFGWLVTTLVGVIDPTLGSRVSLFKDALGTLGGPGNERISG